MGKEERHKQDDTIEGVRDSGGGTKSVWYIGNENGHVVHEPASNGEAKSADDFGHGSGEKF